MLNKRNNINCLNENVSFQPYSKTDFNCSKLGRRRNFAGNATPKEKYDGYRSL